MLSRRQLLRGVPLLPATRVLWCQDANRVAFSTDVQVVSLFATVRDSDNRIVKRLTKDDFALDEDGRPQDIRYFTAESDLPLTVGLLVDTSTSTSHVLPDERNASRAFLRKVLRPGKDLGFVLHFDRDIELLQDVTSNRSQLEKAIDRIKERSFRAPTTYRRFPGPHCGIASTALYDAVFLASDDIMRKQEGRKALVLLSDGLDVGSCTRPATVVESAQRSGTAIYSILFLDATDDDLVRRQGMDRFRGKRTMEHLSIPTGGAFFDPGRKAPLDRVFAIIEEDMRNHYSIGYTPDTLTSGYHRIHLVARHDGLTVQAREGYYRE
jgi:VWFA-related protein